MKMPGFLTGRSADTPLDESFLIGETGFSFSRSQRPMPPLARWAQGEIPETTREMLRVQSGFDGFASLIQAAIESNAFGIAHAEWLLGRTSRGLLSVVVRDAGQCDASRLRDDAIFAVAEAKRYCAVAAIVFVQQRRNDAPRCRDAFQKAFDMDVMEADRLYESGVTSGVPVWFACLSYCVE